MSTLCHGGQDCGLTVRLVLVKGANSKSSSLGVNDRLWQLDTAKRCRDPGGFCCEDYREGDRDSQEPKRRKGEK